MGKIIGVISIKGGVGKTSVSSSLAADLANHHGKKVLVLDANYSAPNLGLHHGIISPDKTIHDVLSGKINISSAMQRKHNLDIISGSYVFDKKINYFKLTDKLKKLKNHYDFIIIDSSPSLNDEMLSTIIASDNLFVVTTPDHPTLYCSMRAAKLASQRGRPISGLILNKVMNNKYELNIEEIEEGVGLPVVAKIPFDKEVLNALHFKTPVSIFNKNSKFSKEINNLSSALVLKNRNTFSWRKLFGLDLGREEVNRDFLKNSFYDNVFDK